MSRKQKLYKTRKSTWIIRFCVLIMTAITFFGSYIVAVPTITGVSPNQGPITGGTRITITGTDLNIKTTKVIDISPGIHSCAITDEHKAYCWGRNDYGQLGIGTADTENHTVPQEVVTSVNFKQIATSGSRFTCAVSIDDKAYCWGSNGYGQLGDGTTTDRYSPTAVKTESGVLAGKKVKEISVKNSSSTISDVYTGFACAATDDGKAYCWGRNASGQLGNNTTTDSYVPIAVKMDGALNGKTVKQISAGWATVCALASDNKAYCWGDNQRGVLGDGTSVVASNVPVAVKMDGVLNGRTINKISGGDETFCVIASDNKAYCWGLNSFGQLGNNTITDSNIPVTVNTSGVLNGKNLTSISLSGYGTTCALDSNRKAYCWGYGGPIEYSLGAYVLGNGGSTTNISTCTRNSSDFYCAKVPIAVVDGESQGIFSEIKAGYMNVCGISLSGKAYCWGASYSGSLGHGAPGNENSPTAVIDTLLNKPLNFSVTVGGLPCASITHNSATSISCTTPPHAIGKVDVVINDGVDTVTKVDAFEYTVGSTSPTVTSVNVSPTPVSIQRGTTKQFSAVVNGTNSPAQTVTWSVTGATKPGTTINSSGLLTVDATEPAGNITVKATSTVDNTKSGTATVTVTTTSPPVVTVTSVTVNPASANIAKGENKAFSAIVAGTNSPAQTVTWSIVTSGVNTNTIIDNSGKITIASAETKASIIVRATSTVDPTKYGEAEITVTELGEPPLPSVSSVVVIPLTVSVKQGETQQFTATVAGNGSPDQTVTWSISGNSSSNTKIDTRGLLSVASNETSDSIIVKATSAVDNTKIGESRVTITKTGDVLAGNDEQNPQSPSTGVMMRGISIVGFIAAIAVWLLTSKRFRKSHQ